MAPASGPPAPNHYGVHARSDHGAALYGESRNDGVGVRGYSNTRYAGQFHGPIYTDSYQDMGERLTPAAPPGFQGRIFMRRNIAAKMEFCVRFPTGAVQVLATEP